jgi:hypothetical protein
MKSTVAAWITDMKDGQKEMTACHEAMIQEDRYRED